MNELIQRLQRSNIDAHGMLGPAAGHWKRATHGHVLAVAAWSLYQQIAVDDMTEIQISHKVWYVTSNFIDHSHEMPNTGRSNFYN